MPDTAASPSAPSAPAALPWHTLALSWMRANPAATALYATIALTVWMFYGEMPLFYRNQTSAFGWMRGAWNPETHYEHGPLVPLIALGLVWFALPRLRTLRPEPDSLGLGPLLIGILFYLLGARTLQPRIALAGLPCILFGAVLYLFGRKIARTLLFPMACLFFMIPVPGVDQATVQLQLFVAKAAQVISGLMGIKLQAVGTSLRAWDESFSFEIAEGCSGINSLMAITLMTAVFAHLTQDRVWKKLILFAGSIPVAIIGNIARLVSIMVVAKVFGQTVAGGWFHDMSAYLISFPFAFGALCLLHKLLNYLVPEAPGSGGGGIDPGSDRRLPAAAARPGTAGPLPPTPSYDY